MSAPVSSSPAASDASQAAPAGGADDRGWVQIDKSSCPPPDVIPDWCPEDIAANRREISRIPASGCAGDASCNCDIHWEQRRASNNAQPSSQHNDLSSSTAEPYSSQPQASGLDTDPSSEASVEPIGPFEILDQSFQALFGNLVDVDLIRKESEGSKIYTDPHEEPQSKTGGNILGSFEVADLVNAAAADDGILARFRSKNPDVDTAIRVGDTAVLQHSSTYYAFLEEVMPIKHGLEFVIRELVSNKNFEEEASRSHTQARLYNMAVSMAKSLDVMEKLLMGDIRHADTSVLDPDLASEQLKSILRDAHEGWIMFANKLAVLQHTLVGVAQKRRFDDAYFQFLSNNQAPRSGAQYLYQMREMMNARRWYEGRVQSALDLLDQMDALVVVNRQHVQKLSAYMHHHRTLTPDWGSLNMPIARLRVE